MSLDTSRFKEDMQIPGEFRYSRSISVGCWLSLLVFSYNLYFIAAKEKTVFRATESGGWDYRVLLLPSVLMVVLWAYLIYLFSVVVEIQQERIKVALFYGTINRTYHLDELVSFDERSGRYSSGLTLGFSDGFGVMLTSYSEDFTGIREYFLNDLP